MFIELNNKHQKVPINKAESITNYFCPICNNKLCIKKGDIRAHHYSHTNKTSCQDKWHYDMTEWHFNWQRQFPVENQEVIFELNGEKHRADVFINNTIFEFQHSNISKDEFQERNEFYKKLGYKIIWIFDVKEDYENNKLCQLYDDNYIWKCSRTNFYNYENDESIKIYLQCTINTWDIEENYRDYDDFYDYSGNLLSIKKDINSRGMQYFYVIEKKDDIDLLKEYLDIKKNNIQMININNKYKISNISDNLFIDKSNNYITDYYGYCPIMKKEQNRIFCRECQFFNIKNNSCNNRFQKILKHKIDKINTIERDDEGRITKLNLTLQIDFPTMPSSIDTLTQLWIKNKVSTTAVVLNTNTGTYWKISNLFNQIEKYNRCYGYYKQKEFYKYSSETAEVFYRNDSIWIMIWHN